MVDLFALTKEALTGMSIELVDVERAARGLLVVTIDRPEGVRIEDCEQVSRHLSRVYEVENIDYDRLEVGSPGTDRPLKRPEDFLRFADERVEIRLHTAVDSRRVFNGTLRAPETVEGVSPEALSFGLEFDAGKGEIRVLNFLLEDVERAKLDPVLDFKGKKR